MARFESKRWGWWYLSISIGYVLLAVTWTLRGARLGAIVLRIVVALGFAMLAWFQFRFGK